MFTNEQLVSMARGELSGWFFINSDDGNIVFLDESGMCESGKAYDATQASPELLESLVEEFRVASADPDFITHYEALKNSDGYRDVQNFAEKFGFIVGMERVGAEAFDESPTGGYFTQWVESIGELELCAGYNNQVDRISWVF